MASFDIAGTILQDLKTKGGGGSLHSPVPGMSAPATSPSTGGSPGVRNESPFEPPEDPPGEKSTPKVEAGARASPSFAVFVNLRCGGKETSATPRGNEEASSSVSGRRAYCRVFPQEVRPKEAEQEGEANKE